MTLDQARGESDLRQVSLDLSRTSPGDYLLWSRASGTASGEIDETGSMPSVHRMQSSPSLFGYVGGPTRDSRRSRRRPNAERHTASRQRRGRKAGPDHDRSSQDEIRSVCPIDTDLLSLYRVCGMRWSCGNSRTRSTRRCVRGAPRGESRDDPSAIIDLCRDRPHSLIDLLTALGDFELGSAAIAAGLLRSGSTRRRREIARLVQVTGQRSSELLSSAPNLDRSICRRRPNPPGFGRRCR